MVTACLDLKSALLELYPNMKNSVPLDSTLPFGPLSPSTQFNVEGMLGI
jgi:hypothetical protein